MTLVMLAQRGHILLPSGSNLGSTDKCRYYPNEHTTNNKHSNQNGLCSRHINRCYLDMAHITIHNLPREYRPGKPFDQVKKSRPLIRLPPVLDGTKYTEGPFPPVFWYGILVDPPALIDIAVDDYNYKRPEKIDPAWPMFSPIWTQSLLKYIGKQAGVAVPIEWRYRRVYCREKIVWCLSISHNYGPYPEQFGVEMKKIWDYFKEKRGLLTMDCPRWYLTMDTNYCEIFWRDRL
ncbi:hypothetical protein QCA50_010755 [Cerrena zonata]|uniref:Uncharacterized protein n=1 Tax=Cerrena zonata TaxID=2478898 RepID=A0AAW0GA69_9APHY